MKDIFIDNNIAKNFKNPADENYKNLINWLKTGKNSSEDKKDGSFLVVSPQLLKEYYSSNRGNFGESIITIIDILTKENRLNRISNSQIKAFVFSSNIEKRLAKTKMNIEDYIHLKSILLSKRKIGIIIDEKLHEAVNQYQKVDGIQPMAVKRPEQIDYKL